MFAMILPILLLMTTQEVGIMVLNMKMFVIKLIASYAPVLVPALIGMGLIGTGLSALLDLKYQKQMWSQDIVIPLQLVG